MQITEIQVHAGRTVNHPYESYSNLRPALTLKATLDPGEDFEAATKTLQAQAENLIEDHKNHMLRSLAELEEMRRDQAEATRLFDTITRAQQDLDRIRRKNVLAFAPSTDNDDEHDEPEVGPDLD